jgi:hypothetical protein
MNTEEQRAIENITPSINDLGSPALNHPEISLLYATGTEMDHKIIQKILDLPRETLIGDLEKVLEDSIKRFDYFYDSLEWNEETHSFPRHALFMLTELKAEESLQKVLNILRQNEDFIEFWFEDYLDQYVWECLFVLGQNKLEELKNYLFEPSLYLYARGQVSTAVSQLALQYPERRSEVVLWYKDVFEYFIIHSEDTDKSDIELMVFDIIAFNGKELEVQLKSLYDCFDLSLFFDTWNDIKRELYNQKPSHSKKRELSAINDHYFNGMENHNFLDEYMESHTPLQKSETKIGRNAPCPCGSGKKYKRCCMDKINTLSVQ